MQSEDKAQNKRKPEERTPEEIEAKRQRALAIRIEAKRQRAIAIREERKQKEKQEQEIKAKRERALAIRAIRKEQRTGALRETITQLITFSKEEKQGIEEGYLRSRERLQAIPSLDCEGKPPISLHLYHLPYPEALFRRDTDPEVFTLMDAAYNRRAKERFSYLENRNVAVVSIRHVDGSVSMECCITTGGRDIEYHSERIALREVINKAIVHEKPGFNGLPLIERERQGTYTLRLIDLDKKKLSDAVITSIGARDEIVVTTETRQDNGRRRFRIYYKSRINGDICSFYNHEVWFYKKLLSLSFDTELPRIDKEMEDFCNICYREITLQNGYSPLSEHKPNTFAPYLFALRQCDVDIFSDRGPCTFDYENLWRRTCDRFFEEILRGVRHRFFCATPYVPGEGQYMSNKILNQFMLTQKITRCRALNLILSIKDEEKKINEEEIAQRLSDVSEISLHSVSNTGQNQYTLPSVLNASAGKSLTSQNEEQKLSVEEAERQWKLQNVSSDSSSFSPAIRQFGVVYERSFLNEGDRLNEDIIKELRHILSVLQSENISKDTEESSHVPSFSSTGPIISPAPEVPVAGKVFNEQIDAYYEGSCIFKGFLKVKKLAATTTSGNGLNCLIYSLLQHASGDYNREQFEDSLVRRIKETAGLDQAPEEQYDDTPNTLAIVKAINQIYRVNLEVHCLQVDVTGKPIILPPVFDSDALGQKQPVMLWFQVNHYVAITSSERISFKLARAQVPVGLETVKIASDSAQEGGCFVPDISPERQSQPLEILISETPPHKVLSGEPAQTLLELTDLKIEYKALCEAINSNNTVEVKAAIRKLRLQDTEGIRIYRNKNNNLKEILGATIGAEMDDAIEEAMRENREQTQQESQASLKDSEDDAAWGDTTPPSIRQAQAITLVSTLSHGASRNLIVSPNTSGSLMTTAFTRSQTTAPTLKSGTPGMKKDSKGQGKKS